MPKQITHRLKNAALRAGGFGALYGGQAGSAEVGVTVPINSVSDLHTALQAFTDGKARVTLMVSTELARQAPDLLLQATQQGHEIAGTGHLTQITLLEASAGQPVQHWDACGLNLKDLQTLSMQGIHPLPFPLKSAEHGQTMQLTPAQLPTQLPELLKNGFKPRPVSELTELRQATPQDLLFHLYYLAVEERFTQSSRIIDLTGRADGVMRVAPLDHAPDPLPLPPGTPTAELHLHSTRLVSMAAKQWLGTYRAYQRSLKDVARALNEHPELQDAQAVFAVTLFHSPLEKVGFTLLDLPPLRARWYGLGFRLLRLAYGTARAPSDSTPKMAWMPREEFLKKFG